MKTINVLFQDIESFKMALLREDLPLSSHGLVMIYTAIADERQAVTIASQIQNLLPQSQIVGASVSGVIYQSEQYTDQTLVVISTFDRTKFRTGRITWEGKKPAEIVRELTEQVGPGDPDLIHVLFSDHYYDCHYFAEKFNLAFPDTTLVGGAAGEILSKEITPFVFTPQGCFKNSMVFAALRNADLHVYNGVSISHEPISTKYQLTGCDGRLWYSINEEPSYGWFCNQLGIDSLISFEDWSITANNDILVRFPVILEGHNGASRFLKYDSEYNCISQYYSRLPKGTEFRIGYVSPSECVKDSFRICSDVMEHPIETLFCYSCLFRSMYLHNCSLWELRPYKNLNLSGAFIMGEFSSLNGVNEFLNGSCCLVGLSENPNSYVKPDINAFEELNKIEDDYHDLLNYVLKRQSENISKYNEILLNQLLNQHQQSERQLYMDANTGLGNYLKYKEDHKTLAFDKLCMVKVDNYELLTSHLGHEIYADMIRRAIQLVKICLENLPEIDSLYSYIFNENTLFLAANSRVSKERFTGIVHSLYDKFRFIRLDGVDEVIITRFVTVSHQENLFESALNAFLANKNIQVPFLICERSEEENDSARDEFKMIGILNRAIQNDGIVPYFQGIYDNFEKRISRYEALMRIRDTDGTIYSPTQFMDTAKKYHLYSHLSKLMMDKVFSLFQNRMDRIGINFSIFDVTSDEIQTTIFDMLKSMGSAPNFVLEILEDEKIGDIGQLKSFLDKARVYDVKVAIDDFGAGYSNLLEIAGIRPDYIKIDGGIIQKIHQSDINLKILDIIVYMGKMLGTDIIAEYVENKEIQDLIESRQIRYSQGYYFSIPKPFEMMRDELIAEEG